jgi:trimeric autotransporter adhesin
MNPTAINRFCAVFLFAGLLVSAAEHHGLVKFGGLPLPGATVIATQGEKRLSVITGPAGAYSFADLADGVWKIRIEMLCFAPAERDIGVAQGAPAPEWEMTLLPMEEIRAMAPAPAQTTQIAATAPPPATPDPPKNAKASKRSSAPQPANTSSAFQRADLTASGEPGAMGSNTPAASTDEVNQAPSDGFLINGSVNNGASSPFAQSAAFGNNRFRRSLYNASLAFVLNNSAWDARSFSLTGQDTPKPGYTHATGQLSLGGPLRIPKLMPRGPDVTLNYQWTRNRNATVYTGLMPAAEQRLGDLSQSASSPVIDPAGGAPFPGNVIPENRISPQAKALLPLYPAPNFAGAGYNYQVPLVGSTHQDALQSRINQSIGKNRLLGQFALQSARGDSTNSFGFLDTSGSTGVNAALSLNRNLSRRMYLTLGYQFSRQTTRATPYFANRWNISGLAGIEGNNQEPANWGPPKLAFSSGIAALSDAQNSLTRDQTSGVTGSILHPHSSHNLTFGGGYRRQQFNLLTQQDPRGAFTFTGAAAGNDLAGFLLGVPDTASIAFGNADKYLRASSSEAYVTDDWRAGASLTLNVGLRWEYNSPITERYGRLVNLATTPGFSDAAPVVAAGQHTYPESLLHAYKGGLQPRIGIAWRPLLASSLVIRAGYGVYYDTSVYQSIATRMAQQPPLSKSWSVQNNAATPLTLADGFTAQAGAAGNTFAVDPHFRPGYAQTWQISVQRDLPRALVASVTYLGNKGTRGQQQFLPNTYPEGAANPCPACLSGYTYLTSNGNSTRQSGQFQLRRRLASGVSAQLTYTLSKSIDDAALGGRGQGGAVIAQDWLNLRGERGLSNFDQRHLLNLQAQYTSGMGLRGGTLLGGWTGALFKDWTVASQITAGSGSPLTPIYFRAVSGTGVTGSIRPDYTGASLYAASGGLFLNPAAVAAPAAGRWGNAGRNSITGPSQFSMNASLARTFRYNDRISADFRIDATNILNHVTFTNWIVVANSAQFGLPSGANAMRNVQANMRVRF